MPEPAGALAVFEIENHVDLSAAGSSPVSRFRTNTNPVRPGRMSSLHSCRPRDIHQHVSMMGSSSHESCETTWYAHFAIPVSGLCALSSTQPVMAPGRNVRIPEVRIAGTVVNQIEPRIVGNRATLRIAMGDIIPQHRR